MPNELADIDDLREGSGKKKNFIGEIVDSQVDLDEDSDYESDIDLVYEIEPIEVLDEDTDTYNTQTTKYLNQSTSKTSKWSVFVNAFKQTFGGGLADNDIKSFEDLCKFLNGKVLEFRDISWDEDDFKIKWMNDDGEVIDQTLEEVFADQDVEDWNNMVVPVRELTDEEKADLGVEDTDGTEVDEDLEF